MRYQNKTKIQCSFQVSDQTILEIKPYIEVSFPCENCQRDRRTIIFINIGAKGICTPKLKYSGFPGRLNSVSITNEYLPIKALFEIS